MGRRQAPRERISLPGTVHRQRWPLDVNDAFVERAEQTGIRYRPGRCKDKRVASAHPKRCLASNICGAAAWWANVSGFRRFIAQDELVMAWFAPSPPLSRGWMPPRWRSTLQGIAG